MSTDIAQKRRLLVPGAASWAGLAAAVIVLSVGVPALGRLQVDLLTTLLLLVAGASAWNIIGGIAGQFSLANSVFVGTGAYITIIVLRDLRLPLVLALLIAVIGGVCVAIVMGIVLFRLRDAYFTIGSLAFALAALLWMTNWEVTGAATGISAPMSAVPTRTTLFFVSLVVATAALAACIGIFHSGYGLALMAIRDDEDAARSLGLRPFALKLSALAVSGGITAAAGGVIALQQITIQPVSAFGLDWSITFIVMAIVGGLGRVWGPTLGAVVVYYLITVQLRNLPTLSILVEGVLLLVLIKLLPGGILGGVGLLRKSVVRWRGARRTPTG